MVPVVIGKDEAPLKAVFMAAQDILLLLSLGIIVLWTTRLARSKGLNPWAWGVGSILLIALAWNFSPRFLGPVVMAPLIFLLLFRSPLFRRGRKAASMPCPKCGAPETGGLNFCVQCGWELSRSTPEAAPEASQHTQETFNSTLTTESPGVEERAQGQVSEEPSMPAGDPQSSEPSQPEPAPADDAVHRPEEPAEAEAVTEPVSQPYAPPPTRVSAAEPAVEPVPEAEPGAVNEPVSEPVSEPAEAGAGAGAPLEPALAQESIADPVAGPVSDSVSGAGAEPVRPAPAPRPLPTPANLTERGVTLFNQGRIQEAIDQFTKAIALDPEYKEAWERRAEAYGRLGRPERQKADQRRLEAF